MISADYHDGYCSSSVSGPSQMAKKRPNFSHVVFAVYTHATRSSLCQMSVKKSEVLADSAAFVV